jgi:hypothetical protein
MANYLKQITHDLHMHYGITPWWQFMSRIVLSFLISLISLLQV